MHEDDLRMKLERAASNEAWVGALAEYFDAHDLCFGHGTDNAGDEAYWLLRAVQDWSDAAWERAPDPARLDRVMDLAERRVEQRKPLAYLLGEAWFAGLKFKVDERVLIPRSPLAELIERCFAPWLKLTAGDRLLDVGTGSGCLAIAAAVHCPALSVDASDNSADALSVAAENVARHGVGDRVRLIQADLFPTVPYRYRVIISNPPYVPAAELKSLPPEYAHEPAGALVGGPSGLEPTLKLLEAAPAHLTADGVLIVEVGNEAEALQQAFPRLPFVWLEFERGGHGVFVISAGELLGAARDRPPGIDVD